MSDTTFRYAVRCETGSAPDSNEDVAYAGNHLLAVADGMRGNGAAAATQAVDALRTLELSDTPAAELIAHLATAVANIDRTLRTRGDIDAAPRAGGDTAGAWRGDVDGTPRDGDADDTAQAGGDGGGASGAGGDVAATTLTAIVRRGTQLALIHIGDTRAYLLRGGELAQLTQDHTWVRDQVEHGKLTPAEAAGHPQRALLTRALGGGPHPVEADLALRTALPGDRYLLCSDGLSAVVERSALQAALAGSADPAAAADRLVELAYAAGAPDNIACVVADLVEG